MLKKSPLLSGPVTPVLDDSLLSASEVCRILSIGKTQLWEKARKKIYPQPIKLGPRTTRWRSSEITRLIQGGVKS